MGFVSMFLRQTVEIFEVCLQSLAFFSNQTIKDLGEMHVIKWFSSGLQWLLLIPTKPMLSIYHIFKQYLQLEEYQLIMFLVLFLFFSRVEWFSTLLLFISFWFSEVHALFCYKMQIVWTASELAVAHNRLQRCHYFMKQKICKMQQGPKLEYMLSLLLVFFRPFGSQNVFIWFRDI